MIADIIGNNAILLQSAASPWHCIHFTQRALYIFAPGMTKDGVNTAASPFLPGVHISSESVHHFVFAVVTRNDFPSGAGSNALTSILST